MALCLIVFISCGIYLFNYYRQAAHTDEKIEELVTMKEQGVEQPADTKTGILGEYKRLYERNSDIVGWVQVKNTKINYPVMSSKEEEYYLHRNFDREYDDNGLPFVDANVNLDSAQSNIMVYGHHMKSGLMFAGLLDFEDEKFYLQHPTIEFDTLTEKRSYEIIAAFYTQIYQSDEKNIFKFNHFGGELDQTNYDTYVQSVKALSCYDTGVTATYGEQLLTLVTCSYHVTDGRFIVVAKRVQ